MIDTKALREKILDLAIRGKLVPQDPNDEPASVLLERIRVQKQQMVKEGKLKSKDIKNDTTIFKGEDNLHYEQFQDGTVKCIEDEIPFEIPGSWAWSRFSSITINRDSERKPVSLKARANLPKIYDYYGASGAIDKVDSYLFDERLLLIGEDGANLITRSKPIAFFAESKYWVNNHAHCIDATDKRYLDFISLYINSISLEKYITGAAQPKMNQDNMNSIIIPVPPFKEQLLINNTITETNIILDEIECDSDKLNELITLSKAKILDLAIRGKLVPQDPNDEPASVLLERIRAEKEELIKQGKIKRDKKESIIFKGEDNSYYQNLPENWELVTFSNIATLISGRDLKPEEYNSDRIGIPYITGASNFNDGNILINRWTTSPKSISIRNDILLTCKGTVGELAINDYDKTHIARQIMAIRLSANINLEYIKLFFESMILEIKKSADGLIPGISRDDILSLNIPLPPLAEQSRIVQAIESSFTLLDNIVNCIS